MSTLTSFIQHCFGSSSHWKKARNKMNTDSKGPSRTYFRGYETVLIFRLHNCPLQNLMESENSTK